MKFKGAVIGLLAAILATCIFTSYRLINEAEKQTQLQLAQAKELVVIAETSNSSTNMTWMKDFNGNWKPSFSAWGHDTQNDYWESIYEPDVYHAEAKDIIEKIN